MPVNSLLIISSKLQQVVSLITIWHCRLGDLTKIGEINHNELKAQVICSASAIKNELAMQVSQVTARIERVEIHVEELSAGKTFRLIYV